MSLNFLLKCNDDTESIFYQKIDTDNIGSVGHSQGGVGAINTVTDTKHSDLYKTVVAESPTNPELSVSLEWDYDLIKNDDNILIVSKDSINRSLERLDGWLKNEDVFLVIDEAHHAVAKTYRKTIKYVEEHAKSMKLLGLTATPFRTSEKEKGALYQIFTDDIVYKIDLNTLIDRHILAYPTFVDGCETGVELGDMVGLKNIQEIENFDALPKNIQEFLQENNKRNSFIVDHYVKNKEKYGKTIVFAINKTNAFALNALFRKNKIRSDYIVSDVRDAALGITISSKENEEKIKQYRDGKLDVLINVNILTEGTDLPQTHTVFLTRPTISRVFMTQMVGRALRGEKAGGTTDAYIVPFIDDWNGILS